MNYVIFDDVVNDALDMLTIVTNGVDSMQIV